MAATKKPTGARQNIFPKGPYESKNQTTNAKRLAAPLASTLSARSPTGRINNLADPTTDNPAGPVRGFLTLAVSPVAGTPTTLLVHTPNARQLVLTEVLGNTPAGDAPEGLLFMQFFLNNAPASALLPIGITNTLQLLTTLNGTAGPATLSALRVNTFGAVDNFMYMVDFDSIVFSNYSTTVPFTIMGLWASGSARLFPLPSVGA
jgi:hypothetical protein